MSENENADIQPDPPVLADVPDGPAADVSDSPDSEEPRHPLADEPLFDETQRLLRQNHRRMQEMAMVGIRLKDVDLTAARLELLIECLLPQESMDRLVFEAQWATIVRERLDQAESEIARARMMGQLPTGPAARAAASGIIIPGQR